MKDLTKERQIDNREEFNTMFMIFVNTFKPGTTYLKRIINAFQQELATKGIANPKDYNEILSRKITQFIYSSYDSIILSSDFKIYGIQGKKRELLFSSSTEQ